MKRVILLLCLPLWMMAKLQVAVSILPEKYFVEQVAGDLADVMVMVAPGASPATYEPKPSQMRALAKARLYLAIGVPFEKAWLPRFKAQNPKMRIVDITKGIEKRAMVAHHHADHAHGEHLHERVDPHVWLSPPLVAKMVDNLVEALVQADTSHKALYRRNGALFKKRIEALDRRLALMLSPCRGMAMMVFHPSWGYFAARYGLRQIPIEIEGKEPKARALARLIREAKEERVQALFIQPEFSRRSARVIAKAIGARLVVADPLASDWARNLLGIARTLCEVSR